MASSIGSLPLALRDSILSTVSTCLLPCPPKPDHTPSTLSSSHRGKKGYHALFTASTTWLTHSLSGHLCQRNRIWPISQGTAWMSQALPNLWHPNDHPLWNHGSFFVGLQNHLHSWSFILVIGRHYIHVLRISENTFESKIRREWSSPKAK